MFERFTDRARHAVIMAEKEAKEDKRPYVRSVHLLAGLVHDEDSVAGRILAGNHGLSVARVRDLIAAEPGDAQAEMLPTIMLPFTSLASEILNRAAQEAILLGNNYIGTEHILLSLTRRNPDPDKRTSAQSLLARAGLDCQELYSEVLEVLRGYARPPSPVATLSTAPPEPQPSGAEEAAEILRSLHRIERHLGIRED